MINLGNEPYKINIKDRIAQIIFQAYTTHDFKEVSELTPTDRGENGFGSTDLKLPVSDESLITTPLVNDGVLTITKESVHLDGHIVSNNSLPKPIHTNTNLIEQYQKHGGNLSHITPYEEQIKAQMKK